ncbi:hypothetical protein ACIQW5_21025 [Methylorubrum thiocyanatum]|jgi:hypothetical protein|uniref:hypothetical protein n=1 Tax=Methylorubrum thiocyanatum TaxID=47958 RepID=UPI00383B6AF6
MQSLLAASLAAVLIDTSAAAGMRRTALRADVEGYAMAACLTRQDVPFLREQGYLWGDVVLQRGHGPVEDWTTLAEAVGAAAARRAMPMARGDGAVHDPLKPMPLLFCHELVRSPAVRAAKARAMRRLAPAYR